jgi:hypothetical protein
MHWTNGLVCFFEQVLRRSMGISNTRLPMKTVFRQEPVEIHKKAMGTACFSIDHAKRLRGQREIACFC